MGKPIRRLSSKEQSAMICSMLGRNGCDVNRTTDKPPPEIEAMLKYLFTSFMLVNFLDRRVPCLR